MSSKRALAREYDFSEGVIQKVWENREEIPQLCALMSEEAKENTF